MEKNKDKQYILDKLENEKRKEITSALYFSII